jgi:hypothetical protein
VVLSVPLFCDRTRPQDSAKCGNKFVGRDHTVFEIISKEFEYVDESICITLELYVFCKRSRYQCSFVSVRQNKSACHPRTILVKCSACSS